MFQEKIKKQEKFLFIVKKAILTVQLNQAQTIHPKYGSKYETLFKFQNRGFYANLRYS